MFDTMLRPIIDPPLNAAARAIARTGVGANTVTLIGGAAGAGAGLAIALGQFAAALALILISRLADGIDGPLSRQTGSSDLGAYLDVIADYAFYTAIPVGFAVARPEWALPAACLLGGFLMAATSFLGFATLAAKRGMATTAQGHKGFYYLGGLAEGAETIAVLAGSALVPAWFPVLAYGYAVLCLLTVAGRVIAAARLFGDGG